RDGEDEAEAAYRDLDRAPSRPADQGRPSSPSLTLQGGGTPETSPNHDLVVSAGGHIFSDEDLEGFQAPIDRRHPRERALGGRWIQFREHQVPRFGNTPQWRRRELNPRPWATIWGFSGRSRWLMILAPRVPPADLPEASLSKVSGGGRQAKPPS